MRFTPNQSLLQLPESEDSYKHNKYCHTYESYAQRPANDVESK